MADGSYGLVTEMNLTLHCEDQEIPSDVLDKIIQWTTVGHRNSEYITDKLLKQGVDIRRIGVANLRKKPEYKDLLAKKQVTIPSPFWHQFCRRWHDDR